MAPILREWLSLIPLHVLIVGIMSYHTMRAIRTVLLIRHRPISVSTIHKTQPNNLLPWITSRQLLSILFTIFPTCKYILIVHYSCVLFSMDSPKSPRTSRPIILERGVKETTGSLYPSKIKQGLIMRISLPHLMDKVDIWEYFYGIIPTCVPLPPLPPPS